MFFIKNKCNKSRVLKFVILITFTFSLSFNHIYSATLDEIKTKIQNTTDVRAQLEKDIAAYEKQLKDLGDQSVSLNNTIKLLTATINKNTLDIKLTQSNIDSTQLQIEELSINIDKDVLVIDKNTKAITLLLNQVNKYDTSSFLENLLAYNNLSEFWNEEQNIYIIQNQIREKISETKNTKIILENNKVEAEQKKIDLLKLQSNLIDKKKLLDISKKEKSKLLSDTKNSEANYKIMLADKKALADSFDKELIQFESELKFAIDQNSIPAIGQGILSWPLDVIRITQKFGVTDFSKTTNAYNGQGHNGVDFAASIGTKIKSALSGTVKGTGNTDTVCPGASFGQWVLVEHYNGLSTLYGHLSLIKVSAGQNIFTGDTIGYSGNTGFSTGPHLHFGVYATQGVKIMSRKSTVCKGTYTMPVADLRAYLDPLQYL